jgi:hypothetical protein
MNQLEEISKKIQLLKEEEKKLLAEQRKIKAEKKKNIKKDPAPKKPQEPKLPDKFLPLFSEKSYSDIIEYTLPKGFYEGDIRIFVNSYYHDESMDLLIEGIIPDKDYEVLLLQYENEMFDYNEKLEKYKQEYKEWKERNK